MPQQKDSAKFIAVGTDWATVSVALSQTNSEAHAFLFGSFGWNGPSRDWLRKSAAKGETAAKKICSKFINPQNSEACQRISQVEGIGPKTATALVAAVGDAKKFKNGRHVAAWLGLVPRHRARGDLRHLFGISKHGDSKLCTLLIHGARAVVRSAQKKSDPRSEWIQTLLKRRGTNRTSVAVANKNARILWALLLKAEPYRKLA